MMGDTGASAWYGSGGLPYPGRRVTTFGEHFGVIACEHLCLW